MNAEAVSVLYLTITVVYCSTARAKKSQEHLYGGIMKSLLAALICLFVTTSSTYSLAADSIGRIHSPQGSVSIVRAGATLVASAGMVLFTDDLIRTGKPGAVGIVLTDDTTISLGPNSELALKGYEFSPKNGTFSLVAQMVKGTFSYLSGLIGKLSPGAVKLIIPDATIAIRGTKLLIEVQE
jgi:hypothetical protein